MFSCGLGCVSLGSVATGGSSAGALLIRAAVDLGVTYFDTADAYGVGESERILGRTLRRRRADVTLATKGGYRFAERSGRDRLIRTVAGPVVRRLRPRSSRTDPLSIHVRAQAYIEKDFSRSYLDRALEGSLRRLRTDYIDIYQLHGPGQPDDHLVSWLTDVKAAGKVRLIGVGLETIDSATAWADTMAIDRMQLPFGILDPEAGFDVIPNAARNDVGVIARAIFAAGLLGEQSLRTRTLLRPEQIPLQNDVLSLAAEYGVSPLQLAAWYVMRPGVHTLLLGTGSITHLRESVGYLCSAPTPDVMGRLDGLVAAHRAGTSI